MIGYVGAHFDILVLVAFGLFACVLGGAAITDALRRER